MRTIATMAMVGAILIAGTRAQTVTLALSSPQNGQTLAPGATIDWSIGFSVSSGNNQGLALLVVDLVQDASNPAYLEIPPASGVPAAMANFSRPAGITNPPETNPITGYTGVQRGVAGHMDLIQIGGAQNTFGVARPPGSGAAESATVVGGVGQSGAEVLASGSFAAPCDAGSYTFRLSSALANVVTQLNGPPSITLVGAATTALSTASISFTITGGSLPGDADGNGSVDQDDLDLVLFYFGASVPPGTNGDVDGNGLVDQDDLDAVLFYFGTACP